MLYNLYSIGNIEDTNYYDSRVRVMIMVFSTTLNNISGISWQSALLVEKIEVPG
jgi:hypothetical protein